MAGGLTGSLEQWPLPELLNMLGSSRQSGRVEVEEQDGRGAIYLQEGSIVHAATAGESGVAALTTLFGWHAGSFSFEPRVPSPAVTLSRPMEALLAEVSREAAERETIRKMIASTAVHPRLVRDAPQHPVTLQPNEWTLVAFADGSQSIASVASTLGVEVSLITRLFFGLGQRGLVEFGVPATVALKPAEAPPEAMSIAGAAVSTDPVVVPPPVVEPLPLPVAIMPAAFFQDLGRAAAAALGPLASVIVEDAIEAHGARMDAFPRQRAAQLVEAIGREIRDDRRRAEFQATMLRILRDQQRAA